MRLVLEPRSQPPGPAGVHASSCSPTRASKTNFPINLVDARPRRAAALARTCREILDEWVAFRIDTVTRRTKHRLTQVDRRIHILEGRAARPAEHRQGDQDHPQVGRAEGRADGARSKLTEIQAEDILEIRLRQLARLEGIKIEDELKALKTERKGLKRCSATPKALSD